MKLVIDPTYKHKAVFGKQKYGKLTLVSCVGYFIEGPKKRAAFKFTCDCGNIKYANARDVKAGKINSCGCLHKETISNIGKANSLSSCQGFKNLLYYRFLKGAKRRNKEVEITAEQFNELIYKNCYYCNSKPTNEFKSKTSCNFKYNGLDRIDSSIHYTMSNVVPCCKYCNWAKNKQTTQEFESWLNRLTIFRCTLNRTKTVNGEIPNTVLNS